MAQKRRASKARLAGDTERRRLVERVQTGLRVEKRILKVLKGLAEYHEISLGDLVEGIVLHVFEGKVPLGEESQGVVRRLKEVYKLDLTAADSHLLRESPEQVSG